MKYRGSLVLQNPRRTNRRGNGKNKNDSDHEDLRSVQKLGRGSSGSRYDQWIATTECLLEMNHRLSKTPLSRTFVGWMIVPRNVTLGRPTGFRRDSPNLSCMRGSEDEVDMTRTVVN